MLDSGTENLVIVDLRNINEFSKSHIKGAVNIPYREDTFPERISAMSDSNKSLIIYCGKGIKTEKAEDIIRETSFEKKYILKGGFREWKEKNFHLEH